MPRKIGWISIFPEEGREVMNLLGFGDSLCKTVKQTQNLEANCLWSLL